MKTETNLMRRIYLNGDEKNLPKEKGEYFAHRASDNRLLIFNRFAESDLEFETSVWMRNVDYYLSPVPRSEIIEIVKKYGDPFLEGSSNIVFEHIYEVITDEIIGGK